MTVVITTVRAWCCNDSSNDDSTCGAAIITKKGESLHGAAMTVAMTTVPVVVPQPTTVQRCGMVTSCCARHTAPA